MPDSRPQWNRRQFIGATAAAALVAPLNGTSAPASAPIDLPIEHRNMVARRKRRIVVLCDGYDVMRGYAKKHPDGNAPFANFRDALFAYVDEPGSQIDAIWWDNNGDTVGPVFPSQLQPPVEHPLLQQWFQTGTDWMAELIKETRRRKLEAVWNHRIGEVDGKATGGLEMEHLHPLKAQHPDWVVHSFWWQGLWNLASAGLREYKVSLLREIVTRYDLDGLQIDFSRHVPCLPVGHQWELRDHVTQFLRQVRTMLLEVAQKRGRPLLLAAKVPRNLEGCHVDGFDVRAWAEQRLVDVLTLGSRSIDVDVDAYRQAVGETIQLQPCFDDHHATDGYRYAPPEFLRGVFANHLQRGANGVVTFNWSIATPEVCRTLGCEVGPLTHQLAYHEIGELRTLIGKNKIYALERRGGYPWAEGFFNRNDTSPLPVTLANDGRITPLACYVSDVPTSAASLTLRAILFQTVPGDRFEFRFNGVKLTENARDPEWKDPQIFSPAPQPTSGGKGDYPINPKQRLLRIECAVPREIWRRGWNQLEVGLPERGPFPAATNVQLEKLELHLSYA